jgi:hypothetical protein
MYTDEYPYRYWGEASKAQGTGRNLTPLEALAVGAVPVHWAMHGLLTAAQDADAAPTSPVANESERVPQVPVNGETAPDCA